MTPFSYQVIQERENESWKAWNYLQKKCYEKNLDVINIPPKGVLCRVNQPVNFGEAKQRDI